MLLAMLGIYGVTSYYVTQRTHEIGVRMALGAQIVDVLKLVLKRAMWLALIGIVIGTAGAVAVTRYMTTLLFGVKPIDVVTFIAVGAALALVVLIACVVPARRAVRARAARGRDAFAGVGAVCGGGGAGGELRGAGFCISVGSAVT